MLFSLHFQIVLHAVFSATIDSYLWMIQNDNSDNDTTVPRPPRFFVLRFAFSIIHGSGRARKTGKAWEHLSCERRLVDARWM